MVERRVVVTGMGAITPLGVSVDAFWDGLISGRNGIRPITHFDAAPFDVRFGGNCADFKTADWVDVRAARRMDPFSIFAVAAAKQAMQQAGLTKDTLDSGRAGVITGTGMGGMLEWEEQYERLMQKGPSKVSAFTIPKLMGNAAAGNISILFGLEGPSQSIATACASAGSAMASARDLILRGDCDVMVTGGSEAALTKLAIAAFAAMKALSTRNDDPAHASRPFDKERDGFVLAEGAGLLIFEDYEHARRRGAEILAEVVGVGVSADAGDIVQPDPEGRGAAQAVRLALQQARLNPTDVHYINAHGTSTPLGDIAETNAIKSVFGAHAYKVPVSSTKSSIGHLLGASGGVEAIATIMAMRRGAIPPTINLHTPDPQCDLDYVPNIARDARVDVGLSNSFGFGGHNTCVAFKKI